MSEQTNYKHVRATLMAAPSPPKTEETPEYDLDHYTVRRYRNTVIVELHSEQGKEKRTESIFLPALAGVTDAELVRAAVCFSPNKWNVSFSMDISQFGRKFYHSLEEPLLSELTSTSPMVLDRSSSRPPSLPHDEVPVPAPALLPQQLPSPVAQPVQIEQQSNTIRRVPIDLSDSRRGIWPGYKNGMGKMPLILGFGALIVIVFMVSLMILAGGSEKGATPSLSNQKVAIGNIPVPAVTIVSQPRTVPTSRSNSTPTVVFRPTPTPNPPTPSPCPAVNCNPWGYNFIPGKLIRHPPGNFCQYFNCTASFRNGNGYVEECQDGTFSLTGSNQNSCSYHGGNLRTLYDH